MWERVYPRRSQRDGSGFLQCPRPPTALLICLAQGQLQLKVELQLGMPPRRILDKHRLPHQPVPRGGSQT